MFKKNFFFFSFIITVKISQKILNYTKNKIMNDYIANEFKRAGTFNVSYNGNDLAAEFIFTI